MKRDSFPFDGLGDSTDATEFLVPLSEVGYESLKVDIEFAAILTLLFESSFLERSFDDSGHLILEYDLFY